MKTKLVDPLSVYIFGLILLAVGLPLSKFLMSVSQFVLIGSWLLHGDLKTKLKQFSKNVPGLLLSALFLLHIVGLLYTTDYKFAFNDIRIKLPLLILPLIISTMPKLTIKQLNAVLLFFIFAVLAGTLVSTAVLTGVIKKQVMDFRKISLFVSHIRFSLMICLAFCITIYRSYQSTKKNYRVLYILLAIWFVYFLFLLESLTGLICLGVVTFCLLSYYIIAVKPKLVYILIYFILIAGVGTFIYNAIKKQLNAYYKINEAADFENDPPKTAGGKYYTANNNNTELENGYYVNRFMCLEEVEPVWNRRSTIKFNETDLKGNPIKFTLIRYVTSKGLRKDSAGIMQLTAEDISQIENGIANCTIKDKSNLERRIYEIIFEFDRYKNNYNVNGHSVTQRVVFWKTAFKIIKQSPLTGVGTGDSQIAFNKLYEIDYPMLEPKFRLRSHNQFLAFGVTFGIFGILLFLVVLLYPLIKLKAYRSFLFATFFIISFLSMLNEDTLETQAGVTFFTFFYCLFLFSYKFNQPKVQVSPNL